MTSKTSGSSKTRVTAPDDAEEPVTQSSLEAEPAAPPADVVVTPAAPASSNSAAHNAAVLSAEQTRQTAMVGVTTQAPAKAADIAFYRACRASAIANGVSPAAYINALRELGTGGI